MKLLTPYRSSLFKANGCATTRTVLVRTVPMNSLLLIFFFFSCSYVRSCSRSCAARRWPNNDLACFVRAEHHAFLCSYKSCLCATPRNSTSVFFLSLRRRRRRRRSICKPTGDVRAHSIFLLLNNHTRFFVSHTQINIRTP